MSDAFAALGQTLPAPFDRARAERTLLALADGADAFTPPPRARAVFAASFGNSPYLARLALREREALRAIIARGPGAVVDESEALARAVEDAGDEAAAMVCLRQAKRRAALAIALADIAGLWSLEQVTRALTLFADAAVGGSLRFLLREAQRSSGSAARDGATLEAETGLVVLAMGKYGAYELNYSSDIDLIVFYDAERFSFRKKNDARAAAVDIVRGLVKLLAETTADGYVFRVDLRLRPDAGATQLAISTEAAEAYYEGMGQNWERAAMIKARSCRGRCDRRRRSSSRPIEPFVWRRNLDFAAIDDIHSIKRQIHAHGGHGTIAVAGHNIKLGRGGIREIEFFAQTQQLILGGRDPSLRPRGTLAALAALCEAGHVTADVASDLAEAYRFLRTLEHRLQMIEDEQTHTLPKTPQGLAHIACFTGLRRRKRVRCRAGAPARNGQGHYARLFERAPPLAAATAEPRLHRRGRRSRNDRNAGKHGFQKIRIMLRAPSVAGTMAAFARRAAPARAKR